MWRSRSRAAREALWSRDLALAWAVNFSLAFVFYLMITTTALYAVREFAVSNAAGGLASSMFVLGATLARIVGGNLVDLVGTRRILLIGLVVTVLASLAYFLIDSFALLLVVRGLHGVVFAMASTAVMVLGQSVIPAARRAEGTGYFLLSVTLATAIGPFLGIVLMKARGHDGLFGAAVLASVLGLLMALFLRRPEHRLEPEERARLRRFRLGDMLHPSVVPIGGFMFLMTASYSGVLTYLNAYAEEKGLESGASLFFIVYAVVVVVARLIAGPVQDRRGDNLVVYVAISFFALGLGALATAALNAQLLLAATLLAAGFGTLMSALQAAAVGLVPPQRTGAAISTYFFMADLGLGIGPVFLGPLLEQIGLARMYAVLAVVVLLSAGFYHRVHGRPHAAQRRQAQARADFANL